MDITFVYGKNSKTFSGDTMTWTLWKRCERRTDGRTDGWTDRRMDRSVLRAALSQLKNKCMDGNKALIQCVITKCITLHCHHTSQNHNHKSSMVQFVTSNEYSSSAFMFQDHLFNRFILSIEFRKVHKSFLWFTNNVIVLFPGHRYNSTTQQILHTVMTP